VAGLRGTVRSKAMPDETREPVTLETLHGDLQAGFADVRGDLQAGFADVHRELQVGFADLKSTLISGFRSLPGRETAEEMVRLLREGNRIQESRLSELDARARL